MTRRTLFIVLQLPHRHSAVLDELVELWEDMWQRKTGSRAVFVAVPPGWGRKTVLDSFAYVIADPEAYPTITVSIVGGLRLDSAAQQAAMLRDCFAAAVVRHRAAELLGVDRLGGAIQLGLGIGGLFPFSFAVLAGMLAASLVAGAMNRVLGDSPTAQVARLARAVAHVSVSIPVVVVIDDADKLDADLALTLISELIGRRDGQVLVVAAVDPGSALMSSLMSQSRYGLLEGRVSVADADSAMEQWDRAALAAEMRPSLPGLASRRIGQRTQTFEDVFRVIAEDQLADLGTGSDDASVLSIVDAVIDVRIRPEPSREAVAVAWAGGILHAAQVGKVLAAMGAEPSDLGDVVTLEFLVRLARPPSLLLDMEVKILDARTRHRMAAAVLDSAISLIEDSGTSLIERVVAAQAAHRVRSGLNEWGALAALQCQLVEDLEALGDLAAALEVARTAFDEYDSRGADLSGSERGRLAAAVLRLSMAVSSARHDAPVIESAIAFALEGGAATTLEARIWAAVNLLGEAGRRDLALTLTDQVTAQMETTPIPEPLGDQWRLLLAGHAAKAKYLDGAQQILTPLLTAESQERRQAAQKVLRAAGDPHFDTRLQVAVLEADLAALPTDADEDRLRVHSTLAHAYERIGDYHRALGHGQHELALRIRVQGPDHPQTLATRGDIASLTGRCEAPAQALRLYRELLPDIERVLGRSHRETLVARNNIALWTSESGDAAEALRQLRELLPDMQRVLGRGHHETLNTRANIADLTGRCGDAAGALRLYRELLPDMEQVLGSGYLRTLATRNNIAEFTGRCGDAAGALRLHRELLPDMEQVLGSGHPDTLLTRNNIALWTGRCGDAAGALRLYRELLPDMDRVLGRGHRQTLLTRNNMAALTGESGDAAKALQLLQELLPDMEQVLGSRHPNTLTARANIAAWTGRCGDAAGALRLYRELLPDRERALGRGHPDALATRNNIALWTGRCGDAAGALRLYRELLPDMERVFGPNHPYTVAIRNNVARLTGE